MRLRRRAYVTRAHIGAAWGMPPYIQLPTVAPGETSDEQVQMPDLICRVPAVPLHARLK
jgi:hypothetical protein